MRTAFVERSSQVAIRRVAAFMMCALLLDVPVAAQSPTAAQASAAKALTVERIWGQPSLSGSLTTGLQWSPDGKLLSYFQRSGTGRAARSDVWVMDVASGERRVLLDAEKLRSLLPATETAAPQTQATGLGRTSPQRYFWSPKGDALLFVSQGDLYWWDLKTNSGRRLTSGGDKRPVEDPKISPDGRTVSFVRNYDLWLVDVAAAKTRQLTTGGTEELMNAKLDWVYPEELDISTAYWWSPDSRQIAYLQMDERPVTRYPVVNYLSYTGETEFMRYPKAGDANPVVRVGVITAAGGKPRWMDIGPEKDIYIPRVNWLRDSRRLAIQRLNRAQNKLDFMIADAASGMSWVAFTDEDPFWINVSSDLYFFEDGKRILWSSERDGFQHLYLYDLTGKMLRQVTRGQWEVSRVADVDEKNGTIFFLATEKSPQERHLYKIPIEGGEAVRLTKESGTHSINLSPAANFYVDSYSNAMTPSRQDLYRADGTHVRVINENRVAELGEYKLQQPEFTSIDDPKLGRLYTMMIKPPNFDDSKKYPAIVYIYGGPSAQVVSNSWGGANGLWHQMMAQRGFVVFLIDNGGAAARGRKGETRMHRRLGEVELAETVAGANYLKSLPYVDAANVGLWGWSYGGYLTTMAMLNAPGVFKAGFAGAPVTDWRQYDTIYTERYMSRPQENAEGYVKSAPSAYAKQLQGKLLIAHGTGDDNVHPANTVKLMEEFIKAGKYPEVFFYPGRGHGISDSTARIHLFNRVTLFFEENLKN